MQPAPRLIPHIRTADPAPEADWRWVLQHCQPLADAALPAGRRAVGIFVRNTDETLCAGAKMELLGPDANIDWLWVAEGHRRQGFGKKILTAAEAYAARQGCQRLALNTMTFQAPEYYPKFGFSEIGRLPAFVHGADRIYFRKPVQADIQPLDPRLTVDETPDPAALAIIDAGLDAHWLRSTGHTHTEIGLYAQDSGGSPIAGLNAVRDHRWCIIIDLWVEPHWRGQGLGRRLVADLVTKARADGCESLWVMPFEWQSPHFFMDHLRMPLVTFFPDAVVGRRRWFLRQDLKARS